MQNTEMYSPGMSPGIRTGHDFMQPRLSDTVGPNQADQMEGKSVSM